MGIVSRYYCVSCCSRCEVVAIGPSGVQRPAFMAVQHPDLFRATSSCCSAPVITDTEIRELRTQPAWPVGEDNRSDSLGGEAV